MKLWYQVLKYLVHSCWIDSRTLRLHNLMVSDLEQRRFSVELMTILLFQRNKPSHSTRQGLGVMKMSKP